MRTLFDISFLFKKKNSVKFKRNPIFSHLHFLLFIRKIFFFVIVHFIIYNNSFKFFNLETIMKTHRQFTSIVFTEVLSRNSHFVLILIYLFLSVFHN